MQATLPVHTFNRTHQYIWHDSFIHMTRLVYALWRDSFIPMIWLVHKSDMTHWYMWRDPFIQVIWLINTCATTHPYIWHTPFINLTWPIHTGWRRPIEYLISCRSFFCERATNERALLREMTCKDKASYGSLPLCTSTMTHQYIWHDWFIHMTWLMGTCATTHPYIWRNSLTNVTWLIHTRNLTHQYIRHEWVMLHLQTSYVIYMDSYKYHDSSIYMTWLIYTHDSTHRYMRHDSSIYTT